MTEYEVVNLLVLLIICNKSLQGLVAAEWAVFTVHTIAPRPVESEGHGPAGVDAGVEALAKAVAEECAEHAERARLVAETVAVGDEKCFAIDLFDLWAVDDFHAEFRWKIVENPDIVVADKPVYFYAGVG